MKDDLSGSQAFSEQVVQPTMRGWKIIDPSALNPVSSKTTAHDLMCLKRAAKHLRTAATLLECTQIRHAPTLAKVLKRYERIVKEMAGL